ncbi:MAG: FAD/NAD(P)-binding oxidoreductase [Cytophagales bacterium]|nr:NAD(P)/FAD-dependent oxidoreductase [Bernardetiaceae bacterium]MDW8210248.1 FAD/NAD(P)-binding oxidoreductase [Cytophagales bacterium]
MKTNYKSHYQVLIAGGGNAGISVAAQLLRKDSKLDLAIIEPSDKHYYQPAWTLVGGGDYDINDTVRNEADFIPKKATWIKDKVTKFDPDNNRVVIGNGDAITYDWLVVCIGIQLNWSAIKGLEGNLGKNGITSNYTFQTAPYTFECIKNFKGGKAIFTNPNTPIKCGGAPQKIMYLAADYFRKHGILDKADIHYYSGGAVIFGVKKYAETLNKVIQRYGIKTHYKHNLVEIRADRKEAVFETEQDGQKKYVVQSYDFIHVTPPQSAPDVIRNSPLAVPDSPGGWVDVDKHTLRHNRYKNVFGIGDNTSTPNAKTGAAIRKQAPILVENLYRSINGQEISAMYNGYGSCPLVTGYGKLVLAEFDYSNEPIETFPFDQGKERWTMYQLKKRILPWLYWNKILRGTA